VHTRRAGHVVVRPLNCGVMRHVELALRPNETLLEGEWIVGAGGLVADATCKRIEVLTASVLKRLANDASGWESLFEDPADGRLWELYYPRSEMQGGGPPSLRNVTALEARSKYKLPATL
jgi:hypothetical protein